MKRLAACVSVVFLLSSGTMGLTGCSDFVEDYGTIHDWGNETWLIQTEAEVYQPVNLADEYQVEGLRVWFRGKEVHGASFIMMGPMIEILQIEVQP